jgi:hypothetical protein
MSLAMNSKMNMIYWNASNLSLAGMSIEKMISLRMNVMKIIFALLCSSMIFASNADATVITAAESTFNTGLQGWSGYWREISWATTGGNPGGYLRWADYNPSQWLVAPTQFLGDWLLFDSTGTLTFDQKVFSRGIYTGGVGGYVVAIAGSTGTAYWYGSAVSSSSNWITLNVPIVESGWILSTGAVWEDLLKNVTALAISPEFYGNIGGQEITGLDNVRLTYEVSQSAVPIPAPLSLLIAGLVGLIFDLWRKTA